jgi:hypothetical protein
MILPPACLLHVLNQILALLGIERQWTAGMIASGAARNHSLEFGLMAVRNSSGGLGTADDARLG